MEEAIKKAIIIHGLVIITVAAILTDKLELAFISLGVLVVMTL